MSDIIYVENELKGLEVLINDIEQEVTPEGLIFVRNGEDEIKAYVEDIVKPDIDIYTEEHKSGVAELFNQQIEFSKQQLSDNVATVQKPALDAYTEVKKAELDECEQSKENELGEYAATTINTMTELKNTAETLANNAASSASEAEVSAEKALGASDLARSWAVDDISEREEGSAKYWAEHAKDIIEGALNETQITNCITKIPQDIKLELKDGTLTLKAGSVLRKADGTAVTVNEDKSVSVAALTSKSLIGYSDNGLYVLTVENFFSGSSAPNNYSIMVWLDTTTNTIKYTTNKGVNWIERGDTLPLGEIVSKTSIDQIFNGFGYIGSTIFALPGVEGLIPNGRNDDGSLNNTKFKTTSVLTRTQSDWSYSLLIMSITTTGIGLDIPSNIYYNNSSNYLYFNNNITNDRFVAGTLAYESGRITSFSPKKAFQAVDRNDTEWVTTNAMPSKRHVELRLQASGASYTAPADGWFRIWRRSGDTGQYIQLLNNSTKYVDFSNSSGVFGLPVTVYAKKGETVTCIYTVTGADVEPPIFIYAEGSK